MPSPMPLVEPVTMAVLPESLPPVMGSVMAWGR